MSQRIVILSSNTGGGHQSAALALEESLCRLSLGQALVNIKQVLEDAHVITRHFAQVYNYLLRHHQHYMKYYYWAIERMKPYQSHMIFQASRRYGTQVIERIRPQLLVSVHPMTQHFFVYILRKLRLLDKIPMVTVVTDPYAGFWQAWACPEVSQYYVASEDAKTQLEIFGIEPDRIQVTGMPVHARFRPPASLAEKQQHRRQLGLDPDRFTVLVNAGWAGGGNVPLLYDSLLQSGLENLQVVFMAGNHPTLAETARRQAAQCPFPVKVMGYTDTVAPLMQASDVMVSKLGGLTTFEAMACHLPILADCLTPPMPQEQGTANFIAHKEAAVLVNSSHQMLSTLKTLQTSPQAYARMQAAAADIARPGAADAIAQRILGTFASNMCS